MSVTVNDKVQVDCAEVIVATQQSLVEYHWRNRAGEQVLVKTDNSSIEMVIDHATTLELWCEARYNGGKGCDFLYLLKTLAIFLTYEHMRL